MGSEAMVVAPLVVVAAMGSEAMFVVVARALTTSPLLGKPVELAGRDGRQGGRGGNGGGHGGRGGNRGRRGGRDGRQGG
eukprot:CAMPEP_0195080236 /NCGR_PEP_ID=MMETSP0448-20130528/21982_1 /TAXON_ID=66468 /ORGANISM="Heterocapsa triquestra, Strain CCMP 448" /LENGTH=78 /DNA_ID=CAMNT_0040113161 /DNA_START=1 /DNA_END=234 /DNA_ORIENTATION=+